MSAIDDVFAVLKEQGFDFMGKTTDEIIAGLPEDLVEEMLAPILADEERARFNRFADLFPDTGPLRRELYTKHVEFFRAGATYRERCFMAANRVGKTVAGGYEVTCHLTGLYPEWWEGKRFNKPVRAWVAGDTNETTRDILQLELLGEVCEGKGGRKSLDGSGLVPRDSIGQPKWKSGVADFVDTIPIKHVTGGWSSIGFKSFDQGRKKFQGTAREVIWLDEECPPDVFEECLLRTATTRGVVMLTFTPLMGLSEMALQFLPKDMRPGAE